MHDNIHAATKKMAAFEAWLAPLFAKAPHLPHSARQTIVQVAPWLALIFGILGLFGLLSAGTFASFLSFSFLGGGMYHISMLIALFTGVAAAVLQLLAFKPLQAHKKKGWNFLFYGLVISAVGMIINMLLSYSYGLPGQILMLIISVWLLFEIREMYS
jgi:hypothetical protein